MKPLSDAQAGEIYERCLDLLVNRGVQVQHEDALALFAKAGANVDTATSIVRFPRDIIMAALESAPRSVTFKGQALPKESGLFCAEGHSGATLYRDPATGEYRDATSADVRNYAQLQESLDEVVLTSYPYPSDVPQATTDIHALKLHLESSSKATVVLALELESLEYLFEMLEVVSGGSAEMKANPPGAIINSMASPFVYKHIDVETIMQAGRHGIPVQLATCTIAGVSSPVTIAGHIVVAATEILGALVISQIMQPGAPCIANPMLAKMNMSTGAAYLCGVEDYLCSAAVLRIAKDLFGIPVASKMLTDSFDVDEQTGFEKCLSARMFAEVGCDLIIGSGGMGSAMVLSPLQAIMDEAFMKVIKRSVAGIVVDAENIAMDDIVAAGPGGSFLESMHTAKHCRESVRTSVFNQIDYAGWKAAGMPSTSQAALEQYRSLMQGAPPVVADDVKKELDAIVARADAKLAG